MSMGKGGTRLAAVLAAASVAAGACGGSQGAHTAGDHAPAQGAAAPAKRPQVDPAKVRANELGRVPVLMYHQIVPKPATVYDRTPAELRAELDRLAREGYVPITAAEFAAGRIDVPAGRHPVVLTFDDSTISQFALGADGRPRPDTAVGILLDAGRRHPGFRPVATMFVNGSPFNDPGGRRTLSWLHRHGFEIGNHTSTHANLGSSSAAVVRKEIAGNQKAITEAVPGMTVRTLALPFGIKPRPPALARHGESGGVRYDHQGIFLVGSNPSPSPYDASFDPQNIPRIRSQGPKGQDAKFASAHWLDQLDTPEGDRYTSDGDPSKISYPRAATTQIAPAWRKMARPY
ncbi:polysaccharide deacetylase family protein [Thermomonospora umbrina]|uniref:Polysaccharide deacetylase n=1 Tax=Thermomonospora umbrina TaxID=111806 RepID=A0A3D9SQ72_9ACTN|nr:polysaccharide deacetylase family protein [Thermomonospora umbrina]REE94724.1 polysaccharide deacetylase [Thermomonospora umbrina]